MSTSAGPRSGTSRYHHGNLRRTLVNAALQLIEQQGLDGLTLRQAARSVGVSHAAVYRHFSDKQALVRAVAVDEMARLRGDLQAALAGIDDPLEAFQAFCVAYVLYAVKHPARFRVLFSAVVAADDDALADARDEMMGMLIAGVEACQRTAAFPKGPPEGHALVAWSLVHGLATLLVDGVLRRGSNVDDPRGAAQMVIGTVLGAMRHARVL